MHYYRIKADPSANDRWYLQSPLDIFGNEIDSRLFTKTERVKVLSSLLLPIRQEGKIVDFNFCDFDMPVVNLDTAEIVEKFTNGNIQRIPVKIIGASGEFEILNVLQSVSCIDEDGSDLVRWSKNDGRVDKIGKIRMAVRIRLDAAKAAGRHIFRLADWKIALVISEELKMKLEKAKVSGVFYERLT